MSVINSRVMKCLYTDLYVYTVYIAVPAGGAGRAIAPASFEDLGKTIIFRAAIRKIWAKLNCKK